MAERRMFTKKITESDAFLDMPTSSQALYFHLSMNADDEGFINAPKRIQKTVGASDDDMKILLAKSFIIAFETGVIVIKHWKMHNYIQNDRFKPTDYKEERAMLSVKSNKAYTLGCLDTKCIQDGYIGKDSIDKDSIGKVNIADAETEYEIPSFDLEGSFKQMFDEYPKKKNYQSCRCAYLDLFVGVFPENYEKVASNLREAMFLFAKDYKDHNPTDKTFKFVPALDVWLKEDALYWMSKVESDD